MWKIETDAHSICHLLCCMPISRRYMIPAKKVLVNKSNFIKFSNKGEEI